MISWAGNFDYFVTPTFPKKKIDYFVTPSLMHVILEYFESICYYLDYFYVVSRSLIRTSTGVRYMNVLKPLS
jgi:hypothetical protein